jgi:hypothetical protein
MRKLGVNTKTKSSNSTVQKRGDHFLGGKLTPHRMDSLLTDWANVRTEKPDEPYTPAMKALIERSDAEIKRLVIHNPDFFGPLQPQPSAHWELVFRVRVFLRLAWDAPDLRQREWFIHEARREYYFQSVLKPIQLDATGGLVTSPPPLTPFERLMYHFHRIADSAHHCQNPECPTPYFFGKKGRKYCSEICAVPSRKEQNRRWWRENRGKNGGNK